METVTVFGATGNVGRCLVDRLVELQFRVRIVTRNEAHRDERVECVVGDLRDREVVRRAMAGADKIYSLAFIDAPELHATIVDEAKRVKVGHWVMLSSRGATSDVPIGIEHRTRERAVEASGIPWTFLRPGYFMTNTLRWAPSIQRDGRVSVPAVDGKIAPIAGEDMAEVVALALRQAGHANRYYELTGDELITAREQVAVLARVLGKPIACVALSLEDAAAGARKSGLPDKLVESLMMMWRAVAAGDGAARTDTFRKLTGHAPMSFEVWAERHRSAFA